MGMDAMAYRRISADLPTDSTERAELEASNAISVAAYVARYYRTVEGLTGDALLDKYHDALDDARAVVHANPQISLARAVKLASHGDAYYVPRPPRKKSPTPPAIPRTPIAQPNAEAVAHTVTAGIRRAAGPATASPNVELPTSPRPLEITPLATLEFTPAKSSCVDMPPDEFIEPGAQSARVCTQIYLAETHGIVVEAAISQNGVTAWDRNSTNLLGDVTLSANGAVLASACCIGSYDVFHNLLSDWYVSFDGMTPIIASTNPAH